MRVRPQIVVDGLRDREAGGEKDGWADREGGDGAPAHTHTHIHPQASAAAPGAAGGACVPRGHGAGHSAAAAVAAVDGDELDWEDNGQEISALAWVMCFTMEFLL